MLLAVEAAHGAERIDAAAFGVDLLQQSAAIVESIDRHPLFEGRLRNLRQAAERMLDDRSRDLLRQAVEPHLMDPESTRLVVEHLSRPTRDGHPDIIGAIRLLRERCRNTGAGLREAKDRVDHVWATLKSLGMGR